MTQTEKALSALAAAINASAALPDVRRDAVFEDLLEEITASGDTYGRAITLRCGAAVDTTRRFGEGPEAFELTRAAEVDWIAAGDSGDSLAGFFDEGLAAIFAAIEADPTLGGQVVRAEITQQPEINREAAGAKTALIARIEVELLFLSPRAY